MIMVRLIFDIHHYKKPISGITNRLLPFVVFDIPNTGLIYRTLFPGGGGGGGGGGTQVQMGAAPALRISRFW